MKTMMRLSLTFVALICATGLLMAGSSIPGDLYKAATFNDDQLSFNALPNFGGSESTPNCTLNPQGPGEVSQPALLMPFSSANDAVTLPTPERLASYNSAPPTDYPIVPQYTAPGPPPISYYPPPGEPSVTPPGPDPVPPPPATPEPGTMLILGIGAAVAAPFLRRRK